MTDEEKIANEILGLCFSEPGDEGTLACVIDTVGRMPPQKVACMPRLVIFTEEGCDVCAEDKVKYAELLEAGKIEEIDSASEVGAAMMDLNGLKRTPHLVLLDCNDRVIGDFEPEPEEEVSEELTPADAPA